MNLGKLTKTEKGGGEWREDRSAGVRNIWANDVTVSSWLSSIIMDRLGDGIDKRLCERTGRLPTKQILH